MLAPVFVLPLCAASMQNVPAFTSPIEITGMKLELHAIAPDRETGKPVDVALPPGLLGPKMKALFATPLSTQLDRYWSSIPDPKTGKIPRDQACIGPDGIGEQVKKAVQKIGSGYGAYDIHCNLARTGSLLVKQSDSILFLGYLLRGNNVNFTTTTPYTCHKHHGTPVCPQDPSFSVTFAAEISTVVRTPDICNLSAFGGTVNTSAVVIDGSSNLTGALAHLTDDLFLGHQFRGAERAIADTQKQAPLPLDSAFKELRDSDACTGKNTALHNLLAAFRGIETTIKIPRGIILSMTHGGIPAPSIGAPNTSNAGTPGQPTFTHPTISASRPNVTAGGTVEISGQYFPANLALANVLPITFTHQNYGSGSIVLNGGVCLGGATELQWGPVNAPPHLERFAGTAFGACVAHFDAKNLTPATAYRFRARDCDAVTCSPWSSWLRVKTAGAGSGIGKVVLTIDGSQQIVGRSRVGKLANLAAAARTVEIGSGTVTPQGTFSATATIPAGTTPGSHTIRAVNGSATAEVAIGVTASNSNGNQASMMMVGLLKFETGCPNHPIHSIQTDTKLTLFGTGFTAGAITIHLDGATGPPLGTVTVGADGSFCQKIPGVRGNQAGAHTLVAVQNGAVRAQLQVTFVAPTLVH